MVRKPLGKSLISFVVGITSTVVCSYGWSLTRSFLDSIPSRKAASAGPQRTPPNKHRVDFVGVQSPTSPLWKVRPGFDVEKVASGFTYPVNLAFANAPGNSPDSPWFYMSELHGGIKYVARDGTVHVYAEKLTNVEPQEHYFSDETGVVGLATIPGSEDLLITTSYIDGESGVLSNKILRLVSEPGGREMKEAGTILDLKEPTSKSHQIQSVAVGPDDKLYVSVGDGQDSRRGMNRERFGGKILRMNLDGTPCKDNPFFERHVPTTSSDFVYAMGLRNAFDFGFDPRTNRMYASDNGPKLDRLLGKYLAARSLGISTGRRYRVPIERRSVLRGTWE